MILSASELLSMDEFSDLDESTLETKLKAVENLIRAYTNNNFQNRFVRFVGASYGSSVYGGSAYLSVDDTVQISHSGVNDGLYVVTAVEDDHIELDEELFTVEYNTITKVEYPKDVEAGVLNLMLWEQTNRDKVGIKSETLSRYSVTYYDQDKENSVMGYPVALLGFLKPYMKARF